MDFFKLSKIRRPVEEKHCPLSRHTSRQKGGGLRECDDFALPPQKQGGLLGMGGGGGRRGRKSEGSTADTA